jgi:hypothetical protein
MKSSRRAQAENRRGAAAVEAAVVLSVFLVLLVGSLDLALAVLRSNTLAEGARRLARAAIVRGAAAEHALGSWGPGDDSGTASDGSEPAAVIRDALVLINPAQVQYVLIWPDGGNANGQRVRAELTSSHRSLVSTLFGAGEVTLRATSVMQIEH